MSATPLREGQAFAYQWLFGAGLGLVMLLLAAAVLGSGGRGTDVVQPSLHAIPGSAVRISADSRALLLRGSGDPASVARLTFRLPAAGPDDPRWVAWFPRRAVDALALEGPGWSSPVFDFYRPGAQEAMFASGFSFPLPSTLEGDVELVLRAGSGMRGTLRPRILREDQVMRVERRGAAIAGMVYASEAMLALLALALFMAARDRTFLAYFGLCVGALLLLLAVNGHLYEVPVLRVLAGWRGQGTWALALLFAASALQTLQRYVGGRVALPRTVRWIDRYCLALVVVAALCLLGLPGAGVVLQPLATLGCAGAAVGSTLLVVDAARRRVPMALALSVVTVVAAAVALVSQLVLRGELQAVPSMRYLYQLAVVMGTAILGVGLVGRVGAYRDQRDRERLARAESDRMMRREAARTALGTMLTTRLRTLAVEDIEHEAFRMLVKALLPEVPSATIAAIAHGYHGRDVLVTEPMTRRQPVLETLARRGLVLKRLAALGMPVQQPCTSASNARDSLVTEAVVPLAIRAPGWGVLLLERTGAEGFSSEELALAGDFARLALMHADQALAAFNLRRSAEVDALTGTFNRRTIDQWLERSFNDAARRGEPLSVLFVDIDHFKAVNDRLGHACGDHCLRAIAAVLRAALCEGSMLARYGGEEFIAVLPGHDGAAARMAGEQVRAAVENALLHWEDRPVAVTVSVGVATRLPSETTPASTIERADKALYAAKRSGRNCVQVAPAVFH